MLVLLDKHASPESSAALPRLPARTVAKPGPCGFVKFGFGVEIAGASSGSAAIILKDVLRYSGREVELKFRSYGSAMLRTHSAAHMHAQQTVLRRRIQPALDPRHPSDEAPRKASY